MVIRLGPMRIQGLMWEMKFTQIQNEKEIKGTEKLFVVEVYIHV